IATLQQPPPPSRTERAEPVAEPPPSVAGLDERFVNEGVGVPSPSMALDLDLTAESAEDVLETLLQLMGLDAVVTPREPVTPSDASFTSRWRTTPTSRRSASARARRGKSRSHRGVEVPGESTAPQFLVVGHITRDLVSRDVRPGGTASYAAVVAARLGLRTAV